VLCFDEGVCDMEECLVEWAELVRPDECTELDWAEFERERVPLGFIELECTELECVELVVEELVWVCVDGDFEVRVVDVDVEEGVEEEVVTVETVC